MALPDHGLDFSPTGVSLEANAVAFLNLAQLEDELQDPEQIKIQSNNNKTQNQSQHEIQYILFYITTD